MAALTLANLMTAVHETLTCTMKIDAVFNWTESQIVWWWINREFKQFKLFVQNRIQKIRSLWSKDHWRHCPSESNPADIASRGSKSSVLAHSDLWWKGAPFLKEGKVQWPHLPDNPIGESTVLEEVTKELRRKPEISNVMTVSVQCFQNISEVICPERFSSLSKLVRVTALVLKFIQRLKRKIETTEISMKDQNIVTNLCYKDVQAKLEEKEKSSSTWDQLGVFKDANGLLRCKGRIQNSSLPYSTKHPILVSRKQHFTKLVIMQSHENVNHNGVGETLTEIRSQFWIIKGRQAVKDVEKLLQGQVDNAVGAAEVVRLQFWVDNNTHFRSFYGLFLCFRERAFIVRKQRLQLSKRSLLTEREIQITSSTIVVSKCCILAESLY